MRGLGHEPGRWRTSSYSNDPPNGTCVEVVLRSTRQVGLRDSAHRGHAVLEMPAHQWVSLLRSAGYS
ncbi:DUF397 domain-containing protein [Nocardiopsis sp. ATB16-24]|uniref:DUF397 domain-containing protein n=1 Tax=Nocardiopsis sp. ATB16-24 TaxID=3019555 RepID=UPI002553C24D|nr:DUF397 domain-containing protein [Nocardiopsis sp. ATB16-24]